MQSAPPCRNRRPVRSLMLTAVLYVATLVPLSAWALDLDSATIAELSAAMREGTLTAEALTAAYLKRIEAYDQRGPSINSVITLNPQALAHARELDGERAAGRVRGPLHGIPIVLKDNFDTFDLPTTGGSQLLEGSIPPDDAFTVGKLRDAGTVIVAKVNLHEFALGGGAPNGYSSLGGQTLNPHDLARGPAGSSGGTGAAIAAAFAQFGLGSDTAGSIRGPSSVNGIAGIKPTRGLLSRDGIIPLALSFDTGGPMARNVHDVAVALGAMTGVDRADPATAASAGNFETDYTPFLRIGALRGARIGVVRDLMGQSATTDYVIERAILQLQALGATIVDPVSLPEHLIRGSGPLHTTVMHSEFKAQIADYLATLGPGYPRTLTELVDKARDPATNYQSPWKRDSMERMDRDGLAMDDPLFLAARDQGLALTTAVVEGLFATHRLDAMVYPTSSRPAGLIGASYAPAPGDPIRMGSATLASQTGFPDVIVPAGMTPDGLPVTLSFFGRAWTEGKLLGYAYDFEQATRARVLPKHTPALPSDRLVP